MTGILHPKCGKRFPNGSRAGHCAGCCETFIGNGAFEQHRVGDHETDRRCEIQGGHWLDDSGHYHYGPRLTDEQKAKMWGKS